MNDEMSLDADTMGVSLDTTTNVLTVDDKNGANKRCTKKGKQKIIWRLVDNLKHATFVSMDDCRPGFEWISWPPPEADIFDRAVIEKSGDLVIDDDHEDTTSDGTWIYKLRVLHEGTVYETTVGLDIVPASDDGDPCARMLMSKNPIIINR